MRNMIDWTNWILEKNQKSNEETLNKSNYISLKKSVKPDTYNDSVHDYPSHHPEMTQEQVAHHSKLFNNANPHHSAPGETHGGEEVTENYNKSAHHYLKTGKALKFPTDPHAGTFERKHFRLPPMAGPKKQLP